MPLSCTCYDDYDAAWYFWPPGDFKKLDTAKRKRCCSCKTLMDIGAEILEFQRTRPPRDDIERNIYGDDVEAVPLAPWYMCESCGEQFLNLTEYGYCVSIGDNMQELLAEHRAQHGVTVEA